MFKRVQYDEWQLIITIIAFILCSSVFLFFCWRAWRMSKEQRRHMSNLPLESEDKKPSRNDQPRQPPERR